METYKCEHCGKSTEVGPSFPALEAVLMLLFSGIGLALFMLCATVGFALSEMAYNYLAG